MADVPAPGDMFPDAVLTASDDSDVRLADFAGQRMVIFFYPKDDTPGCTTENKDFSALAAEFARTGTVLLGVSKDSPEKHRKFIAKHDLRVPLASDALDNGLSDRLGIWAEKQNYGRTYMGMIRTTYLIHTDGRIAQVWNKVKLKGHAEAVLAAVKAL